MYDCFQILLPVNNEEIEQDSINNFIQCLISRAGPLTLIFLVYIYMLR